MNIFSSVVQQVLFCWYGTSLFTCMPSHILCSFMFGLGNSTYFLCILFLFCYFKKNSTVNLVLAQCFLKNYHKTVRRDNYKGAVWFLTVYIYCLYILFLSSIIFFFFSSIVLPLGPISLISLGSIYY